MRVRQAGCQVVAPAAAAAAPSQRGRGRARRQGVVASTAGTGAGTACRRRPWHLAAAVCRSVAWVAAVAAAAAVGGVVGRAGAGGRRLAAAALAVAAAVVGDPGAGLGAGFGAVGATSATRGPLTPWTPRAPVASGAMAWRYVRVGWDYVLESTVCARARICAWRRGGGLFALPATPLLGPGLFALPATPLLRPLAWRHFACVEALCFRVRFGVPRGRDKGLIGMCVRVRACVGRAGHGRQGRRLHRGGPAVPAAAVPRAGGRAEAQAGDHR
jgi:hypothetical protein